MTAQNPKSQMLRVPTVLIPYVKELSRLHRAGHTDSIISGLQHLIADIQSCADSNTDSGNDSKVDSNIDITLDRKLIADIFKRLDQLESVVLQDQTNKADRGSQPVQVECLNYIPASAYTKGFTQYQLCKLSERNYSNLSRKAKLEGMTSSEYLYKYTGWRYRRGRYYPPEKSQSPL
jgi:hypothetical protein